jgi:hypothetical protein
VAQVPESTTTAPAPPDAAAQRQAEKEANLAYGRRLDAQAKTPDNVEARLTFWKTLQLSGMTDPEVFDRYQQALRDKDELDKQEASRRASDSSTAAVNRKMEAATRSLQTRNPTMPKQRTQVRPSAR